MNELQERQAALDHKQELNGNALPSVVQIENLENRVYHCAPGENNILNISYLMKTLRSWHFLISFHMMKEDIIQNELQS